MLVVLGGCGCDCGGGGAGVGVIVGGADADLKRTFNSANNCYTLARRNINSETQNN